jgi:polyferredoxin
MDRQRVRRGALFGSFALFQAFKVFHLFFSPVLLLFASAAGVAGGSLVVYGSLLVSSLVLGRAFCGWLCPGCGVQELVALRVRRPMRRRGADRVKWVVAAGLFGAAAVLAVRAGGLHSVDPFFGMRHTTVMQGLLLFFGHVVIIGGLALALGRWASCHVLCWIAPLLIVGSRLARAFRWPALHLEAEPAECSACGVCDDGCPMSLPVSQMVGRGAMWNTECLLCGSCVDGCPSKAIRFSFARPDRAAPSPG